MSLSYDWHPIGTELRYAAANLTGKHRLAAGDVVAFEHAVWRVVSVRERDPVDVDDQGRNMTVALRPIHLPADQTTHSSDRHLAATRYYSWRVYPDPEHYPVCSCCDEPPPCRAVMAVEVAAKAIDEASRYETPGVCPSCREPITLRQRSVEFPTLTPTGPPVTFHLRAKCHHDAVKYEKRVRAAHPDWRTSLSCAGDTTRHGDGTYDCTQGAECPGPQATHRGYQTCDDPECHALAGGRFGCYLAPTDQRRTA